jgi:zinc transport system substrate-binding protein
MNKILKLAAPFLIVLIISVGLVVYKTRTSDSNSGQKVVTTSFYPLYFLTSEIAGDKVQLNNVTPAGAEPHDYEPSPRQIAEMENGQLLILNGVNLETWGDKVKDQITTKNGLIIKTGDDLATDKDPHVWLSPKLIKKQATKILEGLKEIDPANESYYVANAQKLNTKLDGLDNKFRDELKSCSNKNIVTSHTAFAYLARDYGLTQVSISGLSPDEEPSSQKLAAISEFVKQKGIKYIFFEKLVSPKLAETIANETGAQTLVLDPIEGLSEEDMQQGKNYITIMEDNLKNLKIALECK